MRTIQAADLFCGAGGTSSGLMQACSGLDIRANLLAVNHWPTAIETHLANHPDVRHLCASLDSIEPRNAVPNGRLSLLVASPECLHHSRARGGKPMSDQSRASAWHVLRWCESLRVDNLLVENVREFRDWGPLDSKGRPIRSRKGETFDAWLASLRSLGYSVDFRVLNAADYGDATTRERLFVQARRGRKPVQWPDASHSREPGLFASEPWRAAREIIDWDLKGNSIFDRKKPLAPKTMARIAAGLMKFGGREFVLGQQSCSAPRSVSQPLPTIAAAGAISVIEPFIVGYHSERENEPRRVHSIQEPLPTLTTENRFALAEPFLVVLRNNADGRSLDKPLPTVCAGGGHLGLCEPFIIPVTHGGGENRCHSVDEPLPTVTGANRGEMALCDPFVVEYYGNGGPRAVSEPLATVTTKDRFGLVEPFLHRDGKMYYWDCNFRMLQPHELSAATGFPGGYHFAGNKGDQVRQIGNAVCVNLSRALCTTILQTGAR